MQVEAAGLALPTHPAVAECRLPRSCPSSPQVSGPADASNFDAAQGVQHAKRNSRYISTGVFKDF
jgi:hypothetical protein